MSERRDSKSSRPPTVIRRILAENVRVLRDRQFRARPTETERNRALAAAINSTLSQVQRICKGASGTSIDTLEWLGLALGVAAYQLLIPNFADSQSAEQSGAALTQVSESLQRRTA